MLDIAATRGPIRPGSVDSLAHRAAVREVPRVYALGIDLRDGAPGGGAEMSDASPGAQCTVGSARGATRVPHPSLSSTARLEERIVITPPDRGGRAVAADRFSPTRVGFLSDMPTGDQLGGYL